MSLHFASIDEISRSIRSGEVSPVEVVEEILERIDRIDPVLRSYSTVMAQTARAEAHVATEEIRDGRWRGLLHGVPIAVKDLYGTSAAPTTFGSKHLSNLQLPDAEAVTRLREAGAVITGKLRMSEAALTDHGIDLPVPVNPWDSGTWVGTSSSGCASATAAGLCFGSLGSDTGGSIRGPATAAGLTGLKPTRGAVPADGTLALSRSLDTLGPFARSARDCRLLFEAVAGPSSGNGELMSGTDRPLRIGVAPQLLETVSAATRAMIEETVRTFGSLDVEIFEVTLPDGAPLATDWVRFVGYEALTDLAELYPPEQADQFGPEVQYVLDQGEQATAADIDAISERARTYRHDLDRVLRQVDAILLPTIGTPSPTLTDIIRMRSSYDVWNTEIMRLTCPVNYSGHPALALPTGFGERGTPLGAQLVGRRHEEGLLLHLGEVFQGATDHHSRHPADHA
ncbi:amidase [Ruania albidiflava]|uniref:amidase n=1 Tax=Ruania albidiflava TaxID=366586 RepID=UPI0003B56829|nr:amidase [Ruania albidiflava]